MGSGGGSSSSGGGVEAAQNMIPYASTILCSILFGRCLIMKNVQCRYQSIRKGRKKEAGAALPCDKTSGGAEGGGGR